MSCNIAIGIDGGLRADLRMNHSRGSGSTADETPNTASLVLISFNCAAVGLVNGVNRFTALPPFPQPTESLCRLSHHRRRPTPAAFVALPYGQTKASQIHIVGVLPAGSYLYDFCRIVIDVQVATAG